MARFTPVEVVPAKGGQLITDASSDSVGLYHYSTKRDFRRVQDREILAEGFDRFQPNTFRNIVMPDVDGEAITLIVMARHPNGRTATVVGTQTRLFRYYGTEDGRVFEEGVFETGVFEEEAADWLEIGSGFSRRGARWEWVNINGYLVLNNGVDLPVTYRLTDFAVKPIYELREQGVASVGTIAEVNGVLICGDIRMIREDAHTEIMSLRRPDEEFSTLAQVGIEKATANATINSGTEEEAGNVLTADDDIFEVGDVGREIRMASGVKRTITAVNSATEAEVSGDAVIVEPMQPFYFPLGDADRTLTGVGLSSDLLANGLKIVWDSGEVRTLKDLDAALVGSDRPIVSGEFAVENPLAYAAFTNNAQWDRFQARVLWASFPQEPRRFGAVIPCTVTKNSRDVVLAYPALSLARGQSVLIVGAGLGGTNLTSDIIYINEAKTRLMLREPATVGGAFWREIEVNAEDADPWMPDKNYFFDQQTRGSNGLIYRALIDHRSVATTLVDNVRTGNEPTFSDSIWELVPPVDTTIPQWALGREYNEGTQVRGAGMDNTETVYEALTTHTSTALDEPGVGANWDTDEPTTECLLQQADAADGMAGYEDLQDDGSAVLKMKALRDTLVIYREGSIFDGRFTGRVASPFLFSRVYRGPATPKYLNTLIEVNAGGGSLFHLYAGDNTFYRFDLVTRSPQIFAPLDAVKNLFYTEASLEKILGDELAEGTIPLTEEGGAPGSYFYFETTSDRMFQYQDEDGIREIALGSAEFITTEVEGVYAVRIAIEDDTVFTEENPPPAVTFSLREIVQHAKDHLIFSCDNSVTSEIFICYPSASADKALRFDYKFGTVSTTSGAYTAGATVNRPAFMVTPGKPERWFIMGTNDGEVLRYGLVDSHTIDSGVVTVTLSEVGDEVWAEASASIFLPTHVGRTLLLEATGKYYPIMDYGGPTSVKIWRGDIGDAPYVDDLPLTGTFQILPYLYSRDGESYDGVLQSGLEKFGVAFNEKVVNQYVLILSSFSAESEVVVDFVGARNPSNPETLFSVPIDVPKSENMVALAAQQNYFADKISVASTGGPLEIAMRIWNVSGIDSKSFIRHQ